MIRENVIHQWLKKIHSFAYVKRRRSDATTYPHSSPLIKLTSSQRAMDVRAFVVFSLVIVASRQFEYKHHNNEELMQELEDVNAECPNITRIYTLSETSVLGIPLYLIEFSTKPGHHELSKQFFF